MCGRFNVTSDPMTELFMDFVGQPFEGSTNYNTAPSQRPGLFGNRRINHLKS